MRNFWGTFHMEPRKEPQKHFLLGWAVTPKIKCSSMYVHMCSETQPAFAAKFLVGHHNLETNPETKVHKQKLEMKIFKSIYLFIYLY
jgi:hypothetical protein